MLPRGANAVVMIEHTDVEGDDEHRQLVVRRAVTPGFGIAFAGTDIARGETVLRRGNRLTSRETGVLAAVGVSRVAVFRPVRVAIISTGDELISPGEAMQPARVYDSNAQILADAVRELGAEPDYLGIVRDDIRDLGTKIDQALQTADVVLLSGGTSKGQGDLSYLVVEKLLDPGIVAHGVALKPGKPICLAASGGKPVVILPGFPTSAIFTFHEFVAPVIRRLSGQSSGPAQTFEARMAVKVNSEIGRTEYMLVHLVHAAEPSRDQSLVAYPMGKGSGSVTTFSHADGFITIDRHQEIVAVDTPVRVQLLGRSLQVANLVVIGSHCVGLDFLLSQMQQRGFHTKAIAVGSTAGLVAVERGECDIAGIHLLDPQTSQYNRSFVKEGMELVTGYRRKQGVLFRPDDERFLGQTASAAVAAVRDDAQCVMVNRNAGSGTRILIDQLLDGIEPAGYAAQPRSHNAVAAAVTQSRADWGVAIEPVAQSYGLGFLPLRDEEYDFIVPSSRCQCPAVVAFRDLLSQPEVHTELLRLGCRIGPDE
jgi:putative molybdopterin biosynthesis protein